MTDLTTRDPSWVGRTDWRERYHHDANFAALVDHMVAHIMRCEFTPSEMRGAAMLASIKAEHLRPNPPFVISADEARALNLKIGD